MTLRWTVEDWRRFFAPGIAELIVSAAPPVGWRLLSGLTQIALGVLLFFGSLALRRRTRWGIHLCRLWAWFAIVWAAITMGWAAWWLLHYASEIRGDAIINWQGYAVFGIVLAFVLTLAFPVFLLVWLSKRVVRAEYESWPRV
jgi:peptidoglycan biosynthesis protein MviN/MurJ (putative lipid II flippase)